MAFPIYTVVIFIIVSILCYVHISISGRRAAAGKGWIYAYGKRQLLGQWRLALDPNEFLVIISTGCFDDGTDADIDAYKPQYAMAITNFGRFLIAPYSLFAFSSLIRRFKSFDRSTVSMTEILMEPATPQAITFIQPPKLFTATLILPNARIRLTHIGAGLVEELRR